MWLKLSDDFAVDCARVGLSDAAFRTHTEALLWIMSRESGGTITARDVRRFAETSDPLAAVAEIVAAGLWRVTGDHWMVEHQMQHQIEPDLIAARREKDAERKRRQRRKAAGLSQETSDVTSTVTSGVTARGTLVGAESGLEDLTTHLGEEQTWPDVAVIPTAELGDCGHPAKTITSSGKCAVCIAERMATVD